MSDELVAPLAAPLAVYTRAQFPSLPPFEDWGVDITLSEARLVRRRPGCSAGKRVDRSWDLITGVLDLSRTQVPFRPNVLTAYVGAAADDACASLLSEASTDQGWYTYEFGIGPTRQARRTLTAAIGKAT